MCLWRKWKRNTVECLRDRQGVAYFEFVLALPILLLLFGGSVDVTRMIILHQKVDKAVFTLGDLVSQFQGENPCGYIGSMDGSVIRDIMFPFSPSSYRMSVSSIIGATHPSLPGVQNLIEWRYNTGFPSSKVGGYSSPYANVANMPAPLGTLAASERVIATEMRVNFTPLIPKLSLVQAQTIHKIAYHRSRLTSNSDNRSSGNLSHCS